MKPISYSDAGVDIDAATRATDRIKDLARRTFNERTLSEIGSLLELTRERIRQIELHALRKLRQLPQVEQLREAA